jgi:hypothetical protein
MLAESRPKARRAVISSLALLASSDRSGALTAEQRRGLTTNFVDVFPQLPAGQQPEVLAALRNVGGNDIADILAGKDLSSDDLEIHREYKQALAEGAGARQALAQLEAPAPAAAPSPAALPPATPAEIEPPPSAPAAQPTDDDRPPGN